MREMFSESTLKEEIMSDEERIPDEKKIPDERKMPIEVTQKKVEDMLVASIRFTGDVALIPATFDKILAAARSRVNGNPLVLFYPSFGKEGDDVEVCVPVSEAVDPGEIKTRLLDGGEFVTTTYRGSHDGEAAEGAWSDLFGYINKNDIMVRAPSREVYLVWNRDAPEKNVTELQFLLA